MTVRGVTDTRDMSTQESLPGLAADEWRVDDRTREIGRQGLAEARAALAAARRRAEEREREMRTAA